MLVVRSPQILPEKIDLFLAGGISGCPDWQSQAVQLLDSTTGVVVNPRRVGDLAPDGDMATEQIAWEHDALSRAAVVLFWFPYQTLCPITLLELGAAMHRPWQQLFVAAHPQYQRRFDVIEQLRLQRPEVGVSSSLETVIKEYQLAHSQPPRTWSTS